MNYQENLIQNSFNIWRQFSESYSKNLISLYEKNLEQSKAFQSQMQKALNQMIASQQELAVENIKVLESQTTDFINSWQELIKNDEE